MITPITIIILTLAAVFTSIISGVIGMAGGVTLLSIMTFFLRFDVLIPVHGIVQFFSNSSRSLFLWRDIHWKIFIPFVLGVPGGAWLAMGLIKQLPSRNIPLLLIAALIFYVLFKPKKLPHLSVPKWCFVFIGFMAGILGVLVGATGPAIAPFFLRDDLDKKNIVATKAATQTMVHLLKIPVFLNLGFDYLSWWVPILCLTIAAIIGTRIGVHLLGKVREDIFRILYKAALFLAACRILYKVFITAM